MTLPRKNTWTSDAAAKLTAAEWPTVARTVMNANCSVPRFAGADGIAAASPDILTSNWVAGGGEMPGPH
ncbi:MAG: hypothetical protein IPI27_18355 [Betaproteobacteria bacterium]|nr:hypothetical protein [Betaproteobacteria bacterium]